MRRYPGLAPFTSEQKEVFFGRETDIKELSKLIFVERKVLLYSKSGYGKTSILNAGVIPELQNLNPNFEFIKVRFRAYTEDGTAPHTVFLQSVKQHPDFASTEQTTLIDLYAKDFADEYWAVFKKNQLAGKRDKTYVLVFDQFEELFSYPQAQINAFKRRLADILTNQMPDFVRNFERELFKNKKTIDKAEFDLFYSAINIKAVFSMRSDRLSELNMLADSITDIQKVFYELQPLNTEQAQQAVTNPARKQGTYDSPVFTYAQPALDKIINALTNNGTQNIETTQLQLVCQRIEQNIIAENLPSSSRQGSVLTVAENDIPDFKDIFLDFYNSALTNVTTDDQNTVRKFIEDQLIIDGRRISLDENVCRKHIKDQTLKTLVETRLLRAERNSVKGISYELSHDTLVPPIREIAEKRRQREEEARAEAERREELRLALEKAEEERTEREKERKRQRKIIIIVSVAALVSIAFAVFGLVMWQTSQKIQQKMENQFICPQLIVVNFIQLLIKTVTTLLNSLKCKNDTMLVVLNHGC